jgi:DNA-binding transcriptional regulator YiaG
MVILLGMEGEDLKNWRRKWGLSQEDLAKILRTYQVTVSRWETGARSIPFLLPLALEALENRMKKGG